MLSHEVLNFQIMAFLLMFCLVLQPKSCAALFAEEMILIYNERFLVQRESYF